MNKIIISKEKAIDALFAELDPNRGNGHWRIDVEPSRFGLYEIDTIDVKPFFSQSGNYYPPEVGHICQFGIEAFFDLEGDLSMEDFDWDHFRWEAEKQYRKDHSINLDTSLDELPKETVEAIQKERDNAVDDAVEYTRENCINALASKIDCQDAAGDTEHSYEIVWV